MFIDYLAKLESFVAGGEDILRYFGGAFQLGFESCDLFLRVVDGCWKTCLFWRHWRRWCFLFLEIAATFKLAKIPFKKGG